MGGRLKTGDMCIHIAALRCRIAKPNITVKAIILHLRINKHRHFFKKYYVSGVSKLFLYRTG